MTVKNSSRSPSRRNSLALNLLQLEQRDNPSWFSESWAGQAFGGAVYYGVAAAEGLYEGASNIVSGAGHAIREVAFTVNDAVTIATTSKLTKDDLDSALFNGAWVNGTQSADAQNKFDRNVVYAVGSLGLVPLGNSLATAVDSGDYTQFSKDAGGFGVFVLVPVGVIEGVSAIRSAGAAGDAAAGAGAATGAAGDAAAGAGAATGAAGDAAAGAGAAAGAAGDAAAGAGAAAGAAGDAAAGAGAAAGAAGDAAAGAGAAAGAAGDATAGAAGDAAAAAGAGAAGDAAAGAGAAAGATGDAASGVGAVAGATGDAVAGSGAAAGAGRAAGAGSEVGTGAGEATRPTPVPDSLPTKPQHPDAGVVPKNPQSAPVTPDTPPGEYVFVQDADGVVHVVPNGPHIHPGVLGGGRPAAAAGELTIGPNSIIVEINNISYTFQHTANVLQHVKTALEALGFTVRENAIKPFVFTE